MQTQTPTTTASYELAPEGTGLPEGVHPLNSTRTLVLAFAGADVPRTAPAFA